MVRRRQARDVREPRHLGEQIAKTRVAVPRPGVDVPEPSLRDGLRRLLLVGALIGNGLGLYAASLVIAAMEALAQSLVAQGEILAALKDKS